MVKLYRINHFSKKKSNLHVIVVFAFFSSNFYSCICWFINILIYWLYLASWPVFTSLYDINCNLCMRNAQHRPRTGRKTRYCRFSYNGSFIHLFVNAWNIWACYIKITFIMDVFFINMSECEYHVRRAFHFILFYSCTYIISYQIKSSTHCLMWLSFVIPAKTMVYLKSFYNFSKISMLENARLKGQSSEDRSRQMNERMNKITNLFDY